MDSPLNFRFTIEDHFTVNSGTVITGCLHGSIQVGMPCRITSASGWSILTSVRGLERYHKTYTQLTNFDGTPDFGIGVLLTLPSVTPGALKGSTFSG